jgi:hypothetical protein
MFLTFLVVNIHLAQGKVSYFDIDIKYFRVIEKMSLFYMMIILLNYRD